KSFQNTVKILGSSFFGGNSYYRPLVSLSYMLEYYFFDLNPFFYNLDNLILHLLTTISVFFITFMIFKNNWVGFFTALLFAIHPVHWEAVSNISGRAILLCAFFNLNAFLFFCLSCRDKALPCLYAHGLYVLSLFFFSLALLCKESAVVLPIVLLGHQFFIKKKRVSSFGRSFIHILPFFMILGIYVLVRQHLQMTHFFYWRSAGESILGFISFLRGVITYLRILIWPVDLHLDRMQYLFTNFQDIELLGTLVFFLGAGILIFKFHHKISREELFFLSWFLIELLPVSQILVQIGVCPGYISTAEHFLYTPSIAVFVLIVLFLRRIYEMNEKVRWISIGVFKFTVSGFFIFLWIVTVQQNIYATNEWAMFRQALEYDPANTRVRNSLGFAYAQKGLLKEAEMEFRKALSNDPLNSPARIGLGNSLCAQGKFLEGIAEYEKILPSVPPDKTLQNNLKRAYRILIQKYNDIVKKEPNNTQAYYSLGVVYSKTKEFDAAIKAYSQALALEPELRNALFNLASIQEATGKLDQASFYYQKFLFLPVENDDLFKYAGDHLKLINQKNNAEIRR
ncbi:MAG TPA: tetratricopeptide repeat protein, partial [Candidatus Omnitrophota bacterium]|nr:tetratricopeptide repeat protein [Candidatus Omnitrophota bacterium]